MAQIIWFAGDFAPKYWAICNGQLLSISTNTALFSLLGTTYGGDGRTTFGLPDFRGRLPVGAGSGKGLTPISLGEISGTENTTLLPSNLPSHAHGLQLKVATTSSGGSTDEVDQNILARITSSDYAPISSANSALAGTSLSFEPAGNSQPFSNMKPYVCINAIICLYGVFPSRN